MLIFFGQVRNSPHGKLLKLIEHLECGALQCLRVARNATYTSQRTIIDFLQVMSSVIEDDIIQKMRSSLTIGLMADESTSISVTKELVLYGRAVVAGKIKSYFLKMVKLDDGKANTIVAAITDYLKEIDISISQLSSFGSDGAAVMIGRNTGVSTQLKILNPALINVHCICHRLALASAQAAGEITYLQKVQEILSSLFSFYNRSAVRTAGLKEMQEMLGDPQLKIKEAKFVRWLSHEKAVATIVRVFPSLLSSLKAEAEDHGSPVALGLYTLMTKYEFICAIAVLNDMLPHLSKLSLLFQRKHVDLSMISCLVEATIITVQQRLTSLSEKVYDEVDKMITLIGAGGILVSISDHAKALFDRNVRRPFLTAIIDHLRSRFPSNDLFEAFSIFYPHAIPVDCPDQLGVYGEDKLQLILNHYHDTPLEVDNQKAKQEWEMLRPTLLQQECTTLADVVSFLYDSSCDDIFPVVRALSTRALLLPVSTADCERGFSCMKRLATPLRNRLKTETLDKLIRISAEGAEVEAFDFDKALAKWTALGPHCIIV